MDVGRLFSGSFTRLFFLLACSLILHGCGGGDEPANDVDLGPIQTGIIVDSHISGIQYETSSGLAGTTNANGEFEYHLGDDVTFSLASLLLPSVVADKFITPLDIFNSVDVNDHQVVNFIRLVQSLDSDGDPTNGIQISPQNIQHLAQSGLALAELASPADTFDQTPGIQGLLAAVDGLTELVPKETALKHLEDTLGNSYDIDFDSDGVSNALDDDDDNDGVADIYDAFPWDFNESADFDGDGIGDNRDNDDDNDLILDEDDTNNQAINDLESSLPPQPNFCLIISVAFYI